MSMTVLHDALLLPLLRLAVGAPMEELRKGKPAAGIQRIPVDLVNPLHPTPDPQNCILLPRGEAV